MGCVKQVSLPLSGEKVIQTIQARTDTIILSFSCGKDSIAAWLELRKRKYAFKRIIPVYMWLVPELEFVEESLAYYEQFFHTRIYRIPHPSFYRWLNNFTFQAPERCHIIEEINFPQPNYDDLVGWLAEDLGYKEKPWMATGVRAADSPTRRAAITRYGAINERRRTFFPVWDWNKARLIEEINAAGVKLPVDYRLFGRSFDGIDRRFMEPLQEHYPSDYRRILQFFPLADIDIFRRKCYATHQNTRH
jgi:3'-phosphoadenosine 5'-phosphosulfate sulfotransferase (PAPS reductase)/FAD synthetase